MGEADLTFEADDSGTTQSRSGGLKDAARWLLALGVALAPLIAVGSLRSPLALSDAVVGAGVLFSITLVAGIAVARLWRARAAGSEGVLLLADWRARRVAQSGTRPPGSAPEPSDPLTGLPTFQPFSQQLLEEFKQAKESGGALAVVLVDVNHLTRINRQFGAEVGDQVLRHVTACLQLSKRLTDVLARMGDDEFCLLLPGSDRTGASTFIERVQEWLAREPITVRRDKWSESLWVGICAGMGVCDVTSAEADDVLTAAVDDLNAAREERDRRRLRWKRSA